MIPPCSVQNVKLIWQLEWALWANENLWFKRSFGAGGISNIATPRGRRTGTENALELPNNSLKTGDAYMRQSNTMFGPVPSHSLNQCWLRASWALRNKSMRNLNQSKIIFIQENALENDVCKTSVILFWPQSGNRTSLVYAWLTSLKWLVFST